MERPKMKLPVAVLAMLSTALLLYPSPGFAQQTRSSGASTSLSSQQTQSAGPSLPSPSPTTSSAGASAASTNSSSRQTQSFQPFFPPPGPTIRIIGSPTIQPSRGSKLECTPVEQEIAGVIIGPTDLCDR